MRAPRPVPPGAAWGLAALIGLASPVPAADCRLALALALDVSSSVDDAEYRLQREGLAQALLDPEVVRLFLADEPVALYVFEWASPSMQEPLTPEWQLVQREEDLARIASVLLTHPRTGARDRQKTTGIGAALIHAGSALTAASHCLDSTVDVSGDGRNNAGYDPRYVYAHYPFEGVTVNALIVGASAGERNADEGLTTWFRSNVLHGRGAFWISADGYGDILRAMKAKLLRELETPRIGGSHAPLNAG